MESTTPGSKRCPRCGRSLPKDAPEGLCAACLLAAGAETITRDTTEDAPTALSLDGDDSSQAFPAEQRLSEGQSWGSYRIGRLLGKGGMGEVYEAEHSDTGRRLALKVLRSRLQKADDRARFLREGQLAASISHPHTVYIFGSEEISGSPVISMELLPGGTLKDRVAARGPLPTAEAVSAILDIVGGLDAAHSAGVLHRDIKPSNCFVDAAGTVKVGDFGLSISTLARDVHHQLDTAGFQGTPQFAAPEQMRGEPLDVRADIYAVGATLYYLLTGQPPFEARDLRTLFERVTKEPPKSPRAIRPDVPQGLASIVLQCLAKTPSERPPSYAALAEALRPFAMATDRPARLGLRAIAGVIDGLIASMPALLWLAWRGASLTDAPGAASASTSWVWVLTLVYFFCLEAYWGASLAKRLFGLRVTASDGMPATWDKIAIRTLIYHVPSMLLSLQVVTGILTADTLSAALRSLAGWALLAMLFSTARRHNGWAGLHELASGTRVVHRALGAARHRGSSPESAIVIAENLVAEAPRYGPFGAIAALRDTEDGRLLLGFDPILRRRVWIHDVRPGTPPVGTERRDISRASRLHWLTGARSPEENWDAFEAPAGAPWKTTDGPRAEWPTLKLWLLDLANELGAASRERTLPVLSVDRLWLRNDGRIVLLDFPAPGVEEDGGELTPVRLLSTVAGRALSRPGAPHAAPTSMPLSARRLVDSWLTPSPPSLAEAHAGLVRAAEAPDRVARWRRAVPIGIAAAPIVLLLAFTLLALPALFGFMFQNAEMIGLLEALHQSPPPAQSRLDNPEIREALETYVAGRYGSLLNSDAFWNTPIMSRLQDRRTTAAAILERHPSVSPEELERAATVVAPEIQWATRSRNPGDGFAVSGIIVGTLTALAMLFSFGLSMSSSALVPGGVIARTLGLAFVNRDGAEIGRARSAVRTLVAWSPGIAWLAWLAASPKIQGFVPVWASSVLATGLVLGVLAAGAIWAIGFPSRSLQDRIVGSWIVPR